ncbi:MAG: serine/threonine-protein kinase [bacterium]|nr:serine/threonine-protein kinase [bacterium]
MAKRAAKPAAKVTLDKPATLVGMQLGDYRLKEMLATGGMARIYKGEDVKLGRMAAVKVLTSDMLDSDETLSERFQREAKAVAQMEHDNIITIYQYGEQEGLYFLAMKLVEGGDLADELNALQRQGKLMEPKRFLTLLGQVASALDHAHERGIIHRDVKPSNILIDKSGKAILTDFGLVLRQKVETSLDKTMGTAFGTPRYISPEQALASEKAVPQSDIYSLAVILYEGLTGQMVFKADTAMQIALSHISEPPPPPRSINPNIPRAVEREILKALEKDPRKRHKSASQFLQAVVESYGDALEQPKVEEIPPEILRSATPVFRTPPNMELMLQEKKAAEEQAAKAKAAEPLKGKPGKAAAPIRPSIPSPKVALEDAPTVSEFQRKPEASRRSPLLRVLLLVVVIVTFGVGGFALMNLNAGQDTPVTETDAVVQSTTDTTDLTTETSTDPSEIRTSVGVLPAGGESVMVLYNFDAFALRNDGSAALDVSELVMGLSGNDTFRGRSVTGGILPVGECLVITRGGRAVTIPEDWNCGTPYSTNTLDNALVFWRSTAGAAFEVRAGASVVETCNGIARTATDRAECSLTWPLVSESN